MIIGRFSAGIVWVLLLGYLAITWSVGAARAVKGASDPHLSLIVNGPVVNGPVAAGSPAEIALAFSSNDNQIGAVFATVLFDENILSLNSSVDVLFSLPPGFSGTAFVPPDAPGRVNLSIFTFTAGSLADGTLATLTFQTRCPEDAGDVVETRITFADEPAPSFGTSSGGQVVGSTFPVDLTILCTLPTATPTPTATRQLPSATPTVTPTPTPPVSGSGEEDDDEDAVPSALEEAAPNNGDGNHDGIPDALQENVASLPNLDNSGYLTLAVADSQQLTSVQVQDVPQEPPPAVALPEGLIAFNIQHVPIGGRVPVSLTLHSGTVPAGYWKFGPAPDDPAPHWYRFDWDEATGLGAQIDGNTVILHLVDGGWGDGDLTANGVISDPGGPAVADSRTVYLPSLRLQGAPPTATPTATAVPLPGRPRLIYAGDFRLGAGVEWSHPQVTRSPSGQVFLGEFGNDTVTLSLGGIPPHRQLLIAFDLYLLRSWDGNHLYPPPEFRGYTGRLPRNTIIGPDRWQLTLDGQNLLTTTFANWPSFSQAYPGDFPGGAYPARSGAVSHDSLGYVYAGAPQDTIYPLLFSLPHTGNTVQVTFSGMGLQALEDESWGLDNVRVWVVE